jgi:superfamily II DNA or RNA helicase
MILRSYQLDLACDVMASHLTIARRVLAVSPTGSGKTVTLTYIVSHEKGNVWVIAHRQELIWQLSETLTNFGIPNGIVKSGHPLDPKQRVQVASVQTLVKRMHLLPPPTMIVVDECHHGTSPTYKKIINENPQAQVLGVTATPCRLNGQGLGEVFDHMVLGPTTRWLTDNGFLSPAEYYAPPQVADTSNLHQRGGDFAKEEAEAVMNKPTVTGNAVEHYQRICDGVPMLVFCTSVQHAKDVAEEYVSAGYRAASVDGSMSDEDRKDRIQGLGNGKWQVITSCDLIGEGLDVPIVEAAQLLRPTASLGLHLQQIGRVLRFVKGKTAKILDHVGNVRRHGFATTQHPWSLAGTVKTRKTKEVALRTCERCFLAHDPAPYCPMCGYVYPKKEKALTRIENVGGELVRIEETKEERAEAMRDARSIVELIAFAKSRGYAKPAFWARKVYGGRSYLGAMPLIPH